MTFIACIHVYIYIYMQEREEEEGGGRAFLCFGRTMQAKRAKNTRKEYVVTYA